MSKKSLIHSANLWFADLETFTTTSQYFLKNAVYKIKDRKLSYKDCKTVCYCWSLFKIPCYFNPAVANQWILNKNLDKVKYGVNLADLFNSIIFNSDKQRYYYNNVLFFHNGMNFDNYFILDWIKQSKAFKFIWVEDKLEPEKYPYNFFTASISQGYFSLEVYIWISSKKKHARIRILDSRKLITGSVESISNLYANGIYKDRILKDFGNLDLNKKPLELDYITDYDSEYWYTKYNEKIPFNAFKNVNRYKDTKIEMIKERVGNDSLIMGIIIAYLIVDGVISDIYSNRIFATTGAVATMKFAKDYITKNKISDEEKDPKIFWNKYIFRIEKEDKEKVNEVFTPWCRGGFCSLNEDYQNKIITSDNLVSYDVTSLYPSICVNNALPYGSYKVYKHLPKDLNNKFVFVYFEVEEMEQLVLNVCNLLPVTFSHISNSEKEVLYGDKHYTRKLKNCVFYDILDTCKNIWWNENYFKITGLQNIKYYVFNCDYWLKDFMLKHYEDKKNAKNEVQKLSAKLILNSLTGKFGQKELKEVGIDFYTATKDKTIKELIECFNLVENENNTQEQLLKRLDSTNINDIEKLIIYQNVTAPHSYYPAYAAITALGRFKTMFTQLKMCYNHPNNLIVYSDTDSMKGIGQLPKEEVTTNKELGLWSEEWNHKAKKLNVLRPKVWAVADEENKIYKIASGGINPEKIKQQILNFDDFNLNSEIKTTISHRVIGGKVIEDDIKLISKLIN